MKIFVITKNGEPVLAKSNSVDAESARYNLQEAGLRKTQFYSRYHNALRVYLKDNPAPKTQNPPKPKASDYPDPADLSVAVKLWNKVAKRNRSEYDVYISRLNEFKRSLAHPYTVEEVEGFKSDHCNAWTYTIKEVELD